LRVRKEKADAEPEQKDKQQHEERLPSFLSLGSHCPLLHRVSCGIVDFQNRDGERICYLNAFLVLGFFFKLIHGEPDRWSKGTRAGMRTDNYYYFSLFLLIEYF
jgi:hypothetical protein